MQIRLLHKRGVSQLALQCFLLKFIFPFRDDDRGNAVANEIGQSAALTHKAIDAKNQCHARDGDACSRARPGGRHAAGGMRHDGGMTDLRARLDRKSVV